VRSRQIISFAILLASLCLPGNARAGGDVLLPADNGSANGAPNLGLLPAEPQPALQAPPQPAPTVLPQLPPVQPPLGSTAKSDAPQGTSATLQTYPPRPAPAPMPVPMPAPVMPPVPSSLMIALTNQIPWTVFDIGNVNRQLGLPLGVVTSQCQIGISGLLASDRGTFPFDSNLSLSVNVPYAGALASAQINIYAICASAPKPMNYMQQIGNKYVVSLSSFSCIPQMSLTGMHRLLLTHKGNGNDSCTYQ
jgi:hypothetical protein